MAIARNTLLVVVAMALTLAAVACSQSTAPAPSPTTAPAAAPTKAPAAAPTAAPPAAATKAPTPAPTAAPTAAKPTATSAAAGTSIADLVAKAKGVSEYSFTSKITAAGQTLTAKTFMKSTKMRQEMSVAGQSTVLLVDLANKVAHMVMVDQKMAMKLDFSQAMDKVENPGERIGSLPNTAKLVGTEVVDGKPAAVYEVSEGSVTSKLWIWTERGLPLKIESTVPEGKSVVEFTDYKFEPQPDSLFVLPPGVQVVEMPAGIPGGLPAVKP